MQSRPLLDGQGAPSSDPADSYYPEYNLYEIVYEPVTTSQWRMFPPERCDSLRFWESPEVFQPTMFLKNAGSRRVCNDCVWTVALVVAVLFLVILFAVLYFEHEPADVGVWRIWAMSFCLGLFWNSLEFVLFLFAPAALVRYSCFWVAGVSVLASIVPLVYGFFAAAAVPATVVLASIAFFLIYRGRLNFTVLILRFTLWRFFSVPVVTAWYVGLIIVAGISIFVGQTALYCLEMRMHWIIYVFIGAVYWFIVNVVGQIVYHIAAHLVGIAYFGRARQEQWVGLVWLRGFLYNLGIACFNAAILPFVQPLYWWTAPRVCHGLRRLAARACTGLDRRLTYPLDRGVIYSALFGVSRAEGTRRVAELDSKVYLRLLNSLCVADQVIGFAALVLELLTSVVVWTVIRVAKSKFLGTIEYVAAGIEFFITFGFLHIRRMVVKALVETILICFFELPERMISLSGEAEERLRKYYDEAIKKHCVRERGLFGPADG
jgi:hypothetical protein